jgi:hypothetical protein
MVVTLFIITEPCLTGGSLMSPFPEREYLLGERHFSVNSS